MARDLIDDNLQKKRDVWQRVMAANRDLSHRLASGGVLLDYLPEEDYLYLKIGPATETMAVTLPNDPDTALQVDPETYQISSVEIVYLKERLATGEPKSSLKLLTDLASVMGEQTRIYIPPHDKLAQAEKSISDLVFA
jgi:hypothetical protein